MKKLAILTAILVSNAASAEVSGTSGNRPAADPDQTICRNIAVTGSRLTHSRICKTRAQWAEQRRIDRLDLENVQTNLHPRQTE
jgi:hypothetical protein